MADERGVDVTGFCPIHLGMVLKKMELMGIECERIENGVHVNRVERIRPVDIQTLPFPGFPTDMQAQIMVLSALADGSSVITENIFENRFMFASELVRMGADIRIESHHAMIHASRASRAHRSPHPTCVAARRLWLPVLSPMALPRSRPSITSNVATSSLSKSCRRLARMSNMPPFPIPSSTNAGCLCLTRNP